MTLYLPACILGSHTATHAGGWCADPGVWRGTDTACGACRRECPACDSHPPASFALVDEQQL